MNERLEGWELRLFELIEQAESQPYVLGQHDCFRMACANVQALTGVDLWAQWAGRYSTQRQALRLIAAYGGTFDGAFTRLFGVQPCAPMHARRGDILKFSEGDTPHLGICVGSRVAVLGETGLLYIEREQCELCWRIG